MAFVIDDILIYVAIAAAAGGAYTTNQSARSGQRAQESRGRMEDLRLARERQEAMRNSRIAFANAESAANNQGVSESSGYFGGGGSIQTQGNAEQSFLNRGAQLSQQAGTFLDKQASQQQQANMWGAISDVAFMGAGAYGSYKKPPTKHPTGMSASSGRRGFGSGY